MLKKVKALILRRTRFGEAHAYISALSEDGLITFSAYGIMSPKNKSFASCQPYTLSELVLTQKGDSFTLSQATTVSHLIKQGIDLDRLSLANYISAMASETSFSEEDSPSIYSVTCTALSLVGRGEPSCSIIKAVFELRLTSALGYLPDIGHCAHCGKAVDSGTFLTQDGCMVCNSCILPDGTRGVSVTPGIVSALSHLFALSDRQAFGIRFSDPVAESTFCMLAERYSCEHLDCAVQALEFYKNNIKNFKD